MSQYQKGKTNLDFTEARDSEWRRHQLGHMQVCTSLQTDNHTSTPSLFLQTGCPSHHSVFKGRISWAICKPEPRSRQITTTAPHHSVFTGRMPFLPPNQQRQSTKGIPRQSYIAIWFTTQSTRQDSTRENLKPCGL